MRLLLPLAFLTVLYGPAYAASQSDAEAAQADATQIDARATPGNRWIPTETALQAARAAIASGDWDTAVAQATQARSLAQRSVEQSKEQETAWRDAIIR